MLRLRRGWEEWPLLFFHAYQVALRGTVYSYSSRCLMRAKLEAVLRRVKRPTCRFFGVALLLLWAGGFAPLSPYGDEARIYVPFD